MVSGTAYDQLHGKLDLALDFAGEQRVKNIAGPSAPTASASTGFAGGAGRVPGTSPATLPSRRSLLLAAAAGGWWLWPRAPAAHGPAVDRGAAVRQLRRRRGDGRLADGITEESSPTSPASATSTSSPATRPTPTRASRPTSASARLRRAA